MRKAGAEWHAMTEEEKKPYEKLHEKDVKRYEAQLAELKSKGFFIMADGTKSSDHEVKKKKSRKSGKSVEK